MALLILRESNNTTRYTSKLPNPRHRPCFATPRSGHITTPRPNSSLARQWGNITMPHPGNTPGQHPGTAAERYPGAASSQPRPAPDPPPLRIGPTTSQHCLGALPGARNKKSVRIAAFLRLAIVASSPIANRGTKTQAICRVKAPISLCRDREGFAIAKKLQRCRDFCFHDGRIASTGGYRNGRITATGQITQMCVFSVAARVATSRATDRTKRPPCLAGLGWAAARVQRGLLRIGRSGSP